MKVRNGFVSNSSSSSFVIFGKKIDELTEYKDNIYLIDCEGIGCEGRLCFKLEKEMFDYLKKNKLVLGNVEFIEKTYCFDGDDDDIKIGETFTINKGDIVHCFIKDYSAPCNLEEFLEIFRLEN